MKTFVNSRIDSVIKGPGLATAETHVGDRALVGGLAGRRKLLLGSLSLSLGRIGSPSNTSNNIAHGAAAVRTEHLDSDNVSRLSNAVLGRGNRARAVSTVSVAVLINVVLRDGLAPAGTSFELDVVDIDTSVDNVYVDAFSTFSIVDVLGECP